MAPFLGLGCVPPRLWWFSGAISPGDSSLWPGPTTTQSGSYFSINRPLSASHEAMSHDSDSTPARIRRASKSSVFPFGHRKSAGAGVRQNAQDQTRLQRRKHRLFDRLYQQRHSAKTKGPKRMIRLCGLPFTFR